MLFNNKNDGNNKGFYPAFLGEDLGMVDNIHMTYPKIDKFVNQLFSDLWKFDEIDLSKDSRDMRDPDLKNATEVMKLTLVYQSVVDSMAAHTIGDVLGMLQSNPEIEDLIKLWSYSETIHAKTYSHITKTTVEDPNEILELGKSHAVILERLKIVTDVLEHTQKLGLQYKLGMEVDQLELKKYIILAIVALFGTEGISFSASFASTFAVCRQTSKYKGIEANVKLIARDEMSHVKIGAELLNIVLNEPTNDSPHNLGWGNLFPNIKADMQKILDAIRDGERKWAEYLFTEGRQIVGLNEDVLCRYVDKLSYKIYSHLELPTNFEANTNALEWMDDYLDLNLTQQAAQEEQLVNYKLNNIESDVSDEDDSEFDEFDFD